MQLQVVDKTGQNTRSVDVADTVFAREFNMPLVHQVVTSYLAGARAGTRAQKTRGEVSGSTAKPWRQKGTGRARAGTVKSPLWRHGGVTFAAKPQDHSQKVNKKMYRGAIRSIVSQLIREERLQVIESFTLPEPKTQLLKRDLTQLSQGRKTLLIDTEIENNLYLASRNLLGVSVCDVVAVDPVHLLNADKVLITAAAIVQLGERLA